MGLNRFTFLNKFWAHYSIIVLQTLLTIIWCTQTKRLFTSLQRKDLEIKTTLKPAILYWIDCTKMKVNSHVHKYMCAMGINFAIFFIEFYSGILIFINPTYLTILGTHFDNFISPPVGLILEVAGMMLTSVFISMMSCHCIREYDITSLYLF